VVSGVSGPLTGADGTVSVLYNPNVTVPTDAGSYTASASFTSTNSNYSNASSTVDANLTINQAASVVTVTCTAGAPYTFTGSPITPCTAEATGVGMSPVDVTGSIVYSDNVNAGPATAQASWAGDTNHTGNSGSGGFTINKADAACTVSGYSGVYDGAAHGASGSCTGVGSVVLGGLDLGASFTDVPGGTAHWTFSGGTNYNDQSDDASIALSQASSTTTVTCPTSVVYNGSAQTPCTATATGAGGLSVSVSITHTNNVNVGTANANATYTGDVNHSGSNGSATFEITPAPVTATGGSGTFTYDGATHSPSACTVTGTGTYTGDLTCTNDPSSVGPDAGTTAISPNVSGTGQSNFAITPVNGSYTINQRPATWTTNPASKTYGDGDPAGLTTGSGSGFIAADGVTATYTRVAGENASPPTYHVTATLSATPSSKLNNYIITNAGAEFAINKRNATWTTNPNGKIFGALDPVPLTTGSGSNFVAGDGITATYSRLAGEAVGPYQITATLSPATALNNYNITNTGAQFTIGAWTLNGFYQPVGVQNTYFILAPMAGITWNAVKGGQTVPLKFNVFAGPAEQTTVSAIAGFSAQEVNCVYDGTTTDDVDFVTTGGTELRYTGTPGVDGQFIQNWQTPKTANKCYRTVMTTVDGSRLVSFFRTKK